MSGLKGADEGVCRPQKIDSNQLHLRLKLSAFILSPTMANLKCLVTGGAGFIGSNLALELENQGHEVIVIDNLSTGAKGNLNNFRGRFLDIDVSRPIKLDEKFDLIFHEAAITNPRFGDDSEMMRSNLDGFTNVISLAEKNNAKLIYASTANLYGNGPTPMKEFQTPEIISVYGESKLKMDKMAERLKNKMHIVGLRYFNVFGPLEQAKGKAASMIFHLMNQMTANRSPRLFKYGEQKRDHVYVKDAVAATIKAVQAPSGVYNVGTGVATSFNELVSILNKLLGKALKAEYFEMPYAAETYQNDTQADTSLAMRELNWNSAYSLEEGIKETLACYSGNKAGAH